LRFLLAGPVLPFFWRLGAGASLELSSEAGVFRTLGAGGSPTTATRGVTCSRTWGFRSAETDITKKKYEMRKAEKIPRAQQHRCHCRKHLPDSGQECYRGGGSASGPSYACSPLCKGLDPRRRERCAWERRIAAPRKVCRRSSAAPERSKLKQWIPNIPEATIRRP
jgi:hypothetical protein